jgi:polyisoprenoid-binding protein YceI
MRCKSRTASSAGKLDPEHAVIAVETALDRREAPHRLHLEANVTRAPRRPPAADRKAVTFRSQAITGTPGGLRVTGDLTVGATTVPLELTVDVKQNDTGSIAFSTQTAVPRATANLTWNKMGMIRGDALLKVELELLRDE